MIEKHNSSDPVIVSHSGKQYVHRLIQALLVSKYKVIFCTPLWWQKLPNWLKILPLPVRKRVAGEIRKRSFSFNEDIRLIKRPVIAVIKEITERIPLIYNKEKAQLYFECRHDLFVARIIQKVQTPIVVGYEISSLSTFNAAKKKGIVTVLDLAQIHYKTIRTIAQQFDAMHHILINPDLELIEARKKAEYEAADYILTLSSFARQTMLDEGIPAEKLYEVHLGFDVQLFTPKTLYSTTGALKLMICGTDLVRKGLGILLQVLQIMEEQGFVLELTVIGPLAEIEKVVEQHGRIRALRCLAFMPHEELVKEYQRTDVFVFPSYLDSWAMTVLEAMACGTPVIVTENTGSKDAVKSGGGIIIPTGDAIALQKAIENWYYNRAQLIEAGKKARSIAMSYTWEKYYQEIENVFRDIYKKSGLTQ